MFLIKYLKYLYDVVRNTLWGKNGHQILVIARKVLKNFSAGRNCRCLTCWATVRNSAPAIKHRIKNLCKNNATVLISLTTDPKSSPLHIPFLHTRSGRETPGKEQQVQPGLCRSRRGLLLSSRDGISHGKCVDKSWLDYCRNTTLPADTTTHNLWVIPSNALTLY